jgi:hypothetical protein
VQFDVPSSACLTDESPLVHQSGELETLLENNGVIPKVEATSTEGTAETTSEESKEKVVT